MNRSPITWCDLTWNPITGCTRGCDYCYARKVAERFGAHIEPEPTTTACVSFSVKQPFPFDFFPTMYPHRLDEPLRRKKPATIFLGSMGDLFDQAFPNGFIRDVFSTVERAPQHTFMLLTKRPKRLKHFIDNYWLTPSAPDNLWLGVTVTNQTDADERTPLLLATPAAHYFVSVEPLLGSIIIPPEMLAQLSLVIAGGKTPGKPLHEGYRKGPAFTRDMPGAGDWLRSLRDQCLAAGVPLHYKHGGTNPELDGVVYDWRPR